MAEAYEAALPGFKGMGLREAVAEPMALIDGPNRWWEASTECFADDMPIVDIASDVSSLFRTMPVRERSKGSYLDPNYNNIHVARATPCSLAVARDWHRHRSAMPINLAVKGELRLYADYGPKSEYAKAHFRALWDKTQQVYDHLLDVGNRYLAILALPLGTAAEVSGVNGLRNFVYMVDLRRDVRGANFEYQAQATRMWAALRKELLTPQWRNCLGPRINDILQEKVL